MSESLNIFSSVSVTLLRNTYILCRIQILDIIDVNVPEQYQPLDVVRMVLDELIEKRRRLQGPLIVRQQQRQIEQGAAEVGFQMNSTPKPVFRLGDVLLVHGQHAQIEVYAFVVAVLLQQFQ